MQVELDDFGMGTVYQRGVPTKTIKTADGQQVQVTTVYDLMMAQYGVNRDLAGDYPADYNDENAPFTPAWAEKYTGRGREDVIRFAREWGQTAELTEGKCTIIIGAGINHWYHANLMYRAGIHALMFCGCVGKNGGGLAHYVGQEKLAPAESWASIMSAKDWQSTPRLQNAPSWHYVHSDQWRYEKDFTDYHTVPKQRDEDNMAQGHAMDMQVRAVRNGWLPFYPQFPENPLRSRLLPPERRGQKSPRGCRQVGCRAAEESRHEIFGRRSRCRRELAASVVHLAGQRPDVERQGARVLSAALSRHA